MNTPEAANNESSGLPAASPRRVTPEQAKKVKRAIKLAVHHEAARCVTIQKKPRKKLPGKIATFGAER